MKKLIGLLSIIIGILAIYNVGIEKENQYEIREITVIEEQKDISYYEKKYDIYNEKKKRIVIEEEYETRVDKTSTEEYRIIYRAELDKEKSEFSFSYKENEEEAHSVRIEIEQVEEEYYIFSSNGCITTYSQIIKETGVEKCEALALDPFSNVLGLPSRDTVVGTGLAIGALCVAGVIGSKAGSSNKGNYISGTLGNSSGSISYRNFDVVVNANPDIKQGLKDIGKTTTELKECLASFLGVTAVTLSEFYNSDNKVLCIGRAFEDKRFTQYNDYAEENGFWRFFVKDYKGAIDDYGEELIEIANKVLVLYCCNQNWDFILVTNPYYYMAEHLDLSYGGLGYSMEIALIRTNGYYRFLNTSLTWQTIPRPLIKDEWAFFGFCGYRVSK